MIGHEPNGFGDERFIARNLLLENQLPKFIIDSSAVPTGNTGDNGARAFSI